LQQHQKNWLLSGEQWCNKEKDLIPKISHSYELIAIDEAQNIPPGVDFKRRKITIFF
jgi:hypothetical protein